jgi:enamine deaminase RidA (YjgF/YER057c/UK114 family)
MNDVLSNPAVCQGPVDLLRGSPDASGIQVLSQRPGVGESLASFADQLAAQLRACHAIPLLMLAYGPLSSQAEFVRQLRRAAGPLDWPLQWVEGACCAGELIAGVQTYALRAPNDSLQRLMHEGRVVGSFFQDATARHCLLGGLGSHLTQLSPAEQTRDCFSAVESCLDQAGLSLADIAHTWFYNERILDWYADFNAVRNSFYGQHRFRIGSLPASTAVEGRNPRGSALQLAAWALRPHPGCAEPVRELASPLQCPAPSYGSAFSRAVSIDTAGERRILVSGTASIEPGGRTVWLGDARRQIELSMQVVSAILQSEGTDFSRCTRALAYFKDPSFLPLFEEHLLQSGLEGLPYVPVHCDICRDDLLFEIELDASAPSPSN